MGYYPSKICALLNIVIMLGYGMIDCLVGGQVLSAVAGGNMTVIVGTIIVAIITWIVVIFGMSVFHKYERWAWVPQLIALFVLVGCAGPKFDTNIPSVGSSRDILLLTLPVLCRRLGPCWCRLLRVLPADHQEMDHLYHELLWHRSCIDICQSTWSWSRLRDLQQC